MFRFLVLVLLVVFSACDNNRSTDVSKSEPAFIVGLSMADLKEERWKRDRDIFKAKIEALGGRVLVQDAGGDPQYQIEQTKNLILQGASVLVVVPKNAAAGAPIVQHAHQKGVKVISYDRMIGNSLPDFYVSFDNYKVGQIQAQEILKQAPKGKYMLLGGDPADLNAHIIRDAHMDVLKPAIEDGSVEIVSEPYADKWLRSEATRYAEDTLAQHPDLVAVVASNDGTAGGVVAALRAKGKAGEVKVSGQDADLEACRNIVKGYQTVTVYKPIKELAENTAIIAAALAQGKSNEELRPLISSGKLSLAKKNKEKNTGDSSYLKDKVPSLLLEPLPVTKNSIDIVVEAGFHKKKEIFG